MSAREELNRIVFQSKLNSSLLFMVRDSRGKIQYVPLDGIGYCVENLNPPKQRKFLDHCKKLVKDQDALLNFLKKLAQVVASRKL